MKPSQNRLKVPSDLLSLFMVITLAITGLIVFSHPGTVNASSTLTFTPVADSYVNQSSPTKNFGTNRSIRVDGSPLVRSYLRFDVNGIGSSNVIKVTLRIYANSGSSNGVTVDKVADNNWQENEINYDNAPAPGNQIGSSNGFPAKSWVSIDVTSLLSGDGTVSLTVLGIDQQAINLASREDNDQKPQLLVEISSDANPTATNTSLPSVTATRTIGTECDCHKYWGSKCHTQPTHPDHRLRHRVITSRASPSGQCFIIPGSQKPGISKDSIPSRTTHQALDFTIRARCLSFRTISAR